MELNSLVWLSAFRWQDMYASRCHHLIRPLAGRYQVLFVETRFSLREKLARLARNPRSFFGESLRTGLAGCQVLSIYATFPRRLCAYVPFFSRLNGLWLRRKIGRAARALGMGEFAAGTDSPYLHTHVIGKLGARVTFYDCIDEHAYFTFAPPWSMRLEKKLIDTVDVVLASSHHLQRTRERLGGKPVHYLPNAVEFELFAAARGPVRKKSGERPVIGFVGYLGEWVDFGLLDYLMRELAHCDFVIVGEAGFRGNRRLQALINRHPNCRGTGLVPYEDVPALIRGFDAAIIPFFNNPLVQGVSPIKLFEYAACGVPVVATRWEEIEQYEGLVYLASDRVQFRDLLRAALYRGRQPGLLELAARNSWQARAEEFSRLLARSTGEAEPAREAPSSEARQL